ncbi:MAG: ParB/RepB/Spo0J family partition protein [bacterium]
MQIIGPKSLNIKELRCILFKTGTRQPSERLYLSIKEKGIKEPLLVTPLNDNPAYPKAKYEIVDGFRRFSVAKELNAQEVPALIIEDTTERELQEIALLRNTLQSSLSPIEKALYIKKLKDTYDYRNVELASLLGVQKSYITELLSIFNLDQWAIRKLKQKQNFTVAHARILSRCDKLLQDQKKLKEIIRKTIDEKWSIKHLRYELRKTGYLEATDPYINVDGLFNRMNSILNQNSGRFTKTVEIHFDDLRELRQKLTEVSKLLSRFTEFLPEEVNLKKFTE